MRSETSVTGLRHPLDAFVDISGSPYVHTSKPTLRTFNRQELGNIMYVGLCLDCHADFHDRVMKEWRSGRPPEPCRDSGFLY